MPCVLRCLAALLLSGLFVRQAWAHELEVDQLRLWVDPNGQLRAQWTLDPELTRREDEEVQTAVARTRVREWALTNLSVDANGKPCTLDAITRELYVQGGATPGDVVMLSCTPQGEVTELRVQVRSGVPPIALDVVGFVPLDSSDATTTGKSQLVSGGSTLVFVRTGPDSAGAGRSDGTRVSGVSSWFRSAGQFLLIGVEHVVPRGFDHVLLVLSVTLTRQRFFALSWQLGAFTLAHTLTLALGSSGLLVAKAAIVEPLIALSIVVMSVDNLLRPTLRPRVALCFAFGLIHGLGFAGALGDVGLRGGELLPALLGFNLGVEIGQVFVAGCALASLALLERAFRTRKRSERGKDEAAAAQVRLRVERWGSVSIAAAGLFLLVDRLL